MEDKFNPPDVFCSVTVLLKTINYLHFLNLGFLWNPNYSILLKNLHLATMGSPCPHGTWTSEKQQHPSDRALQLSPSPVLSLALPTLFIFVTCQAPEFCDLQYKLSPFPSLNYFLGINSQKWGYWALFLKLCANQLLNLKTSL